MKQMSVLRACVGLGVGAVFSFAATPGRATILQANAGNVSQTFFTVSATDLVNQGQPSLASQSYGSFVGGLGTATPTILNNGLLGGAGDATQGTGQDAGGGTFTTTYVLTGGSSGLGFDITNIVVYSAWSGGRAGNKFSLQYNTFSNPTLISLGTWTLTDDNGTLTNSTRLALSDSSGGALSNSFGQLTGVQTLVFTLSPPPSNLAPIYREIDVFGLSTAVPEPSTGLLLGLGSYLVWQWRKRQTS